MALDVRVSLAVRRRAKARGRCNPTVRPMPRIRHLPSAAAAPGACLYSPVNLLGAVYAETFCVASVRYGPSPSQYNGPPLRELFSAPKMAQRLLLLRSDRQTPQDGALDRAPALGSCAAA